MGWSAVKYRHHLQILRFWIRFIKTPGDSFQRDLALSSNTNWSHDVLIVLELYDHVSDKNNPIMNE